ncbi:hypothetical protein KaCgl_16920 [Corynebacterium glutamicum]|nr:hypothetical protein KaCgl_16920 [Corynebacterium glutamicum]
MHKVMTLCMHKVMALSVHKVMTLSVHKVMTLSVHNPLTQNSLVLKNQPHELAKLVPKKPALKRY